jgi:hypothetical protein
MNKPMQDAALLGRFASWPLGPRLAALIVVKPNQTKSNQIKPKLFFLRPSPRQLAIFDHRSMLT